MTMTPEMVADVESFAVPELALEFTHTLCRVWAEESDDIRAGGGHPDTLYKLLDSLASVVIPDFQL